MRELRGQPCQTLPLNSAKHAGFKIGKIDSTPDSPGEPSTCSMILTATVVAFQRPAQVRQQAAPRHKLDQASPRPRQLPHPVLPMLDAGAHSSVAVCALQDGCPMTPLPHTQGRTSVHPAPSKAAASRTKPARAASRAKGLATWSAQHLSAKRKHWYMYSGVLLTHKLPTQCMVAERMQPPRPQTTSHASHPRAHLP